MHTPKNTAFVCCVTQSYLFAFATLLLNLKEKSPKLLEESDVFLFYDEISFDQKRILESLHQSIILKKYELPKEYNFHQDGALKYSKMALTRFECFDLLHTYKYLVYSDVDILVAQELYPLLETLHSPLAFCENPNTNILNDFYYPLKNYNMQAKSYYSGLIVFQNSLNSFESMRNYCYQKLQEYEQAFKYPDLCVLNLLLQDYKIIPTSISLDYCCIPSNLRYFKLAPDQDVKIFHAAGKAKFWSHIVSQDWERYYKVWLKKGGTSYKGKVTIWLRLIRLFKLQSMFDRYPHPLFYTGKFFKRIKMLLKKL